MLLPGQQIKGGLNWYTVGSEIASGGLGIVYHAIVTDGPDRGRPVAIKAVKDAAYRKIRTAGIADGKSQEFADAVLETMLQREALVGLAHHHPNLLAILDLGVYVCPVDGRRPFVVMEHIQGSSLRDVLRIHGPLPPPVAVEIVVQVLAALDHLHSPALNKPGVVHRDVKPDNVMVQWGANGSLTSVKLIDFGIARAVPAVGAVAMTDAGTPGYMAPEVLSNGKRLGDKTIDIFSTGRMLHQLVSNIPPSEDWVVSPTLGRRDIDVVVARATDLEPQHRFQTAAQMRKELETIGRRIQREASHLTRQSQRRRLAASCIEFLLPLQDSEGVPSPVVRVCMALWFVLSAPFFFDLLMLTFEPTLFGVEETMSWAVFHSPLTTIPLVVAFAIVCPAGSWKPGPSGIWFADLPQRTVLGWVRTIGFSLFGLPTFIALCIGLLLVSALQWCLREVVKRAKGPNPPANSR